MLSSLASPPAADVTRELLPVWFSSPWLSRVVGGKQPTGSIINSCLLCPLLPQRRHSRCPLPGVCEFSQQKQFFQSPSPEKSSLHIPVLCARGHFSFGTEISAPAVRFRGHTGHQYPCSSTSAWGLMCETEAKPGQPVDAAAGSFLKNVQQSLVCDDITGKRDRCTTA